jgi:phosphoesterase RecJ-like protein
MAITSINQQAIEVIKLSDHTLICFPEAVSGDGVGSALGLARALEGFRPGHQVDVISSGFADDHRHRYRFLPGVDRVKERIEQLHDLTVRIPLGTAEVKDVRHEVRDGHLEIRLTPGSGQIPSDHIEAAMSQFRYDLIIVLDCPDLAALGSLYSSHAAFFQSTPIIAIDHAPEHERYGQINCIDLAAAACGEVCARFLREVAPTTIDPDVATCLMAGIIAETRGFRSPRLSVRTFEVTSLLLQIGARREEIFEHLFRTKTVGQLQLWGRALTRLKTEQDHKLVWTLLSQHDFLASRASEADLPDLVDELLVSSPDARVVLLLYERADHTICVLARTIGSHHDASALLKPIGGIGDANLARACLVPQDLQQAERVALETVRGQLAPRT